MKDFIIYGAGITAGCMLVFGIGCDLAQWLRDRREDMKLARAIRLGQMAYEHSYDIQPDNDVHEWCLAAEKAAQEGWIPSEDDMAEFVETGLDQLQIHAAWKQRPEDELEAA